MIERWLRHATTLAFLVLCLVGIAVGIKHLVSDGTTLETAAGMRTPPPPARPVPPVYTAGERITLQGVDFAGADRTLLLVVQQGCRFCDESMPFYQRLSANPQLAERTRLVVVAPDDEGVTREELAKHDVEVHQIVRAALGGLKVRGTPTAIMVSRQGVVQRIWTGLLREEEQADLLQALTQSE
jgi:hypothetical protein